MYRKYDILKKGIFPKEKGRESIFEALCLNIKLYIFTDGGIEK